MCPPVFAQTAHSRCTPPMPGSGVPVVGVPYFLPRLVMLRVLGGSGMCTGCLSRAQPTSLTYASAVVCCSGFALCCLRCAALALCCSCTSLCCPCLCCSCLVLCCFCLCCSGSATCAPTPLCLLLACGVSVSGMSGAVMFSYVSCHCVCCSVSAALTFPDHV